MRCDSGRARHGFGADNGGGGSEQRESLRREALYGHRPSMQALRGKKSLQSL